MSNEVTAPEPGSRSPFDLDVVCVGHAIVDWMCLVDPEAVDRLGLHRGTMTLIDIAEADRLGAALGDGRQVSGGSAANTAAGIASLGGSPLFVGAVASDALGARYGEDLEATGVHCLLGATGGGAAGGTGRCFALVTPDADRTMATYLGTAPSIAAESVDAAGISERPAVYLEGYLFDPPVAKAARDEVVALAGASGTALALSLSDPFLVERHHDELSALVRSSVDVLFGNEAEILTLTGCSDLEGAAAAIRRDGLVVFVTLGDKGALVVTADGALLVPAFPVERVVDTTGAGDLFAAGALFGLVRGASHEMCAELGALAAAEVISHIGARPETSLAEHAAKAGLGLSYR